MTAPASAATNDALAIDRGGIAGEVGDLRLGFELSR